MVAQTASRALGLCIPKDKAHGGIPFICYGKLYDSLVQPVISYGAAIWVTKDYACIAEVQNRACQYCMCLGKTQAGYTYHIAYGSVLQGNGVGV